MVANRASHKAWACALLVAALLLLAGPVLALGLGQIQVKSRPGEPLLAEIPVVAGDPSELRDLQVRFASPETFRRVGLQPPDVAGTGLQLSVALDDAGRSGGKRCPPLGLELLQRCGGGDRERRERQAGQERRRRRGQRHRRALALVGAGLAVVVPLVFSAAGNADLGSTGAGLGRVVTMSYTGSILGPVAIGAICGLLVHCDDE